MSEKADPKRCSALGNSPLYNAIYLLADNLPFEHGVVAEKDSPTQPGGENSTTEEGHSGWPLKDAWDFMER